MTTNTAVLWNLAYEVLNEEELDRLRALTDDPPPDFDDLLAFDRSLDGPGMHNVNRGTSGGYHIEDRDVFRWSTLLLEDWRVLSTPTQT